MGFENVNCIELPYHCIKWQVDGNGLNRMAVIDNIGAFSGNFYGKIILEAV
jgi:hypothetical protein